MYNFVRILVDYQLIYRRGLKFGSFTTSTPLYKINKRGGYSRGRIVMAVILGAITKPILDNGASRPLDFNEFVQDV